MSSLTLVSFDLCPYVQRAAIVLAEKGVAFDRVTIDLGHKPDWFTAISPLGKVPLLRVGNAVLFESTAIVEYLDDVYQPRLHPDDPLERARHRGWMQFGSSILADIWTLETTSDQSAFDRAIGQLASKFVQIEAALGSGLYFAGTAFTIVDAVFAPIFRYFDVFDAIRDLGVFKGLSRVPAWRRALAERSSVRHAVVTDYADRLRVFLKKHDGIIAESLR